MTEKQKGWDQQHPEAGVLDADDPRARNLARTVPKGAVHVTVGKAKLGHTVRRKKRFSGLSKRINELVRLLPERDDWRPFLSSIGDAVVGKSRQIAEREASQPGRDGSINLDEVARLSVGTILHHLPECTPEEALEVAMELASNPYYLDAKEVAVWHMVTSEERQRLKFQTIGVYNQSKAQWTDASEKARNKRAKEKKRQDRLSAGATPRSQSVAARLRAAGIAPSTYYKKLKEDGVDLLAEALRRAEIVHGTDDAPTGAKAPRPLRRAETIQEPPIKNPVAGGGADELDTFGAPSAKQNATFAETLQVPEADQSQAALRIVPVGGGQASSLPPAPLDTVTVNTTREEPMSEQTATATVQSAGPDAPPTSSPDPLRTLSALKALASSASDKADAAILEFLTKVVGAAESSGFQRGVTEGFAREKADRDRRNDTFMLFVKHPAYATAYGVALSLAHADRTYEEIKTVLDIIGETPTMDETAGEMAVALFKQGHAPASVAMLLLNSSGMIGRA